MSDIRAKRVAAKMSLRETADAIGVSCAHLAAAERGESTLHPFVARLLEIRLAARGQESP